MTVNQYIDHDGIAIASGRAVKYSHINKFGYNPALGNSYETIHDAGGIYSYISTAGTASVAGASDSGAVIEVQGLDAGYNAAKENITVGSTGSINFIRVFRARVVSVTSGTTNDGNITITVDSAVRATILAGNGQTLMAVYTVPKGKRGYLIKFQGSIDKSTDCIYKLFARPVDDGAFNLKGQFGTFGTPITYDYPIPLEFNEKTDIEIRAKAGSTAGGGAIFDIVLVDK